MEAEEREPLEGQNRVRDGEHHARTIYVAHDPSVGARLVEAAKDGMSGAWGFVVGSAVVLLSAGPTMLIIAVGLYGAYRVIVWGRRRRRASHVA